MTNTQDIPNFKPITDEDILLIAYRGSENREALIQEALDLISKMPEDQLKKIMKEFNN